MKKLLCSVLLLCIVLTGCQNASVEEIQSQLEDTVQDKKDEIVASAQKEAKNAMVAQIESFFSDPELASRLGISEDKKEELLQKLEETVQNYDMEASGIEGFQDQINHVLQDELQENQQTQTGSSDDEHSDGSTLESGENSEDTVDKLKEELQNAMTQFLGKDGE